MIKEVHSQKDLLSVSEVAKMLHVSSKTINRLIGYGHGELPAVMIGSRWKVHMADLKEYLKKQGSSFGGDRPFEAIVAGITQDRIAREETLQLDVQKKCLELTAAAFEVATKMVTAFYPDADGPEKVMLISAAILNLLEARSMQQLEQAILKIVPIGGEQERRKQFWNEDAL